MPKISPKGFRILGVCCASLGATFIIFVLGVLGFFALLDLYTYPVIAAVLALILYIIFRRK